ncbi:MAG: L-arabinose isomerase [Cyclobacteriaceae bacterium]|nr:L-arabinose isomerase [Cyclobacteriaceae bacterium]
MINKHSASEVWFVTGSQHLYGDEVLKTVATHAKEIASGLGGGDVSVKVVCKEVMTGPESITRLCHEANQSNDCLGLITWMHTFSPAKMWIGGLKVLVKPILHLHTQFNSEIPWGTIDMNFMNLNQSAHGDREFGYIMSRMKINRKVVVGHWKDEGVKKQIGVWTRAAAAWHDWQGARFCRFGDNMRQVAVTEGDKVEAEIQFGYSVNGYGIGDLARVIDQVTDKEVDQLVKIYEDMYQLSSPLQKAGVQRKSLTDAARIEIGMRQFLKDGNFRGFTTTFEDLHGLPQLPGIAVQRLMADGYGFGAEGDWKTSALVRAMKVMGAGLPGGSSFMEDYTYHFDKRDQLVLGAHMLEICPSIAKAKPSCEVHPLSIGGKEDPVRLVFDVGAGAAINASMIDLGDKFRLLVNEVEAVEPREPMPKLPVARVLWRPLPDMQTGCAAWIQAGGAHHTCFSQNLTSEHLTDFARIAGVEMVRIGAGTTMDSLGRDLQTFNT